MIITLIIVLLTVLILSLVGELDKIRRFFYGVERGVKFEDYKLGGYLRAEVHEVVSSYAQQNIRYPTSATINESTGEIISENRGEIIDITATVDKIVNAQDNAQINPVNYKIIPFLKEVDLSKITERIGRYTTIITGSQGRRSNIKLATKLINNTLVLSGESFSFNQEVGPRTKEAGFKEAPQIADGNIVSGLGGGICQVSSTLYNALAKEKLVVTELHHHSQDVGYVPDGQDATIAWKYLDFKFENRFSNPILIKGRVVGSKLIISILATKKERNKE